MRVVSKVDFDHLMWHFHLITNLTAQCCGIQLECSSHSVYMLSGDIGHVLTGFSSVEELWWCFQNVFKHFSPLSFRFLLHANRALVATYLLVESSCTLNVPKNRLPLQVKITGEGFLSCFYFGEKLRSVDLLYTNCDSYPFFLLNCASKAS